MLYKVVIAIRSGDTEPWEFHVPPVAEFVDEERAVRFAKSEIKAGWGKCRVRVISGRKVVWSIT